MTSLGTAESVTAASSAGPATGTRAELLSRFPPRPVAASWPTTEAARSAMVNRLFQPPFALENRLSQQQGRRPGVLAVVSWLQARSGATWQERWLLVWITISGLPA